MLTAHELLYGEVPRMACILVQFDPPRDPAALEEYARWFRGDAARMMRSIEGLTEARAFRNVTGTSPLVTTIAFFQDLPQALAAARSPLWNQLVASLSRWGCDNLLVTLLESSPILPEPQRPA
ncbi:MAG: hypothetical protein HY688_03700 [Chloroflexi bacterium]|nr:hypothetical protein [Chloroflexota bacterium]